MAQLLTASTGLIRNRDLFFHDGSKLRRIRLSVGFQALLFVVLMALVAWSAYSAARLLAPTPAAASLGLAELEQATERRALQIEHRQQLIAALIAGEQVDGRELAGGEVDLPQNLDARFDRVEDAQAAQAAVAAAALDARYRVAAAELKKLGINPARLTGGVGGPLEPVGKANPTFKQLFMNWKKLDNLQNGAIAVPSDKPVKTAAFTSGYGVRSDPFQGRSAMHAGIDLSGPSGTPIYATADGLVTTAGWNSGGYGNLIKVDHGRGIETRYGHLSSLTVRPGQRVKRGELIGRMGSTGRSTGSHLHYEVRIDGRAVNPVPFMKSTDYLLAMQRNVGNRSMDQIALGGPQGAAKR